MLLFVSFFSLSINFSSLFWNFRYFVLFSFSRMNMLDDICSKIVWDLRITFFRMNFSISSCRLELFLFFSRSRQNSVCSLRLWMLNIVIFFAKISFLLFLLSLEPWEDRFNSFHDECLWVSRHIFMQILCCFFVMNSSFSALSTQNLTLINLIFEQQFCCSKIKKKVFSKLYQFFRMFVYLFDLMRRWEHVEIIQFTIITASSPSLFFSHAHNLLKVYKVHWCIIRYRWNQHSKTRVIFIDAH